MNHSTPVDTEPSREQPEEMGRFPVLRIRHWYLTLSALLAIFVALTGGTYQLVRLLQVEPLAQKHEEVSRILATKETDYQSLKSQLATEQTKYAELLALSQRPVLLSPPDGASIIGTKLLFSWDYGKHDNNTRYIFELKQLSPNREEVGRLIGVPQSEMRRLFVPLGEVSADMQWRVRPGYIVNGIVVPTGPWSAASSFSVFPTVLNRILSSGVLRVASTPTSYDSAKASDGMGGFTGYDIEVAKWLSNRLSKQLGLQAPLKMDLVDVSWERLFSAIQRGEADIAIRSITRTLTREHEYPNLRFTRGYLRNHQVFIQTSTGGEFPASLNGTIVGVKRNSINEKAAEVLAVRHHFKVDASFTAYADIYHALQNGRINFALVDSALVSNQLGIQYFQFGPHLDEMLKSFYLKELGTEYEEYAVLVSGAGSSDRLRKLLDEAIADPEFIAFSKNMKIKYGLN